MAFNQQSVNDNGGVSWTKQVAENMDPGAIESQIQSYQNAAGSLAKVQTTLQNVKNNLAASWSGDAADQAQTSFQGSIDHAQLVQDTITQAIIPPLQSAKSAQQTFINSVKKVPDEQPVPSNNLLDDVGSFFGVESPAQKAQSHNIVARNQAADALNSLSDSYETSASKLSTVGGSKGSLTTTGNTGAFPIGPVESSSGDGAATAYSEGIAAGGTNASPGRYSTSPPSSGTISPGPDPKTTLSGTNGGGTIVAPPTGPVSTSPPPNSSSPYVPSTIWGPTPDDPGPTYGGGAGVISDEPDVGSNGPGGGGPDEGDLNDGLGGKPGGNNNVFDETGMGDGELTGGSGSGPRNGMSNSDGVGLDGDGDSVINSGGMLEGDGGEGAMGGTMGQGMGGGGGGEELGSSKYSRGRYVGVTEEDDSSSLSPVRSAYENATDADGNKVDMMGAGRRGASGDDEEDERGKRPSYLKEDEFWKNAQRIVPPVIQ